MPLNDTHPYHHALQPDLYAQKHTEQSAKALYQKLCAAHVVSQADSQALWIRLHLLMQTYRALFPAPWSPELLQELLDGTPRWLDRFAPAIGSLLKQCPLRHSVSLPRELLHAFCGLYRTSFVADLGNLYQWVQPMSDKKRKGQVFTPESAVRHAFSLLRAPVQGRLLDLSCGAGDFLLVAYRELRAQLEASGRSSLAAHTHILQHQLYGADNDPLAVFVARCRLALECPESPLPAPHVYVQSAYEIFGHPLGQQDYQLIFGNPPWGSQLSPVEKRLIDDHCLPHPKGRKLYNSFLYFLETSVKLLRPQGRIALLLPAAFLNVQSYHPVRQWLLQQVEIDALHYAPELFRGVYAPALFLSATKTSPAPEHEVRIYKPGHDRLPTRVPQRVFTHNEEAIFNIHYEPRLDPIFRRLHENCFYLHPIQPNGSDGTVDYVLGIVTGNNGRHLTKQPREVNSEPILTAENISRFHLSEPKRYIVYDRHSLQQAAPKHKYKTREKLLYKFISKELIVAIDRSGHYTVNNLNALLPVRLPVSLRYLAGLMNSILLNTYYMYHFFTGKVTAHHLSTLPLKRPTAEAHAQIEGLVSLIEQSLPSEQPPLLESLNEAVYRLYGVTAEEQAIVEQQYKQLQQTSFV